MRGGRAKTVKDGQFFLFDHLSSPIVVKVLLPTNNKHWHTRTHIYTRTLKHMCAYTFLNFYFITRRKCSRAKSVYALSVYTPPFLYITAFILAAVYKCTARVVGGGGLAVFFASSAIAASATVGNLLNVCPTRRENCVGLK